MSLRNSIAKFSIILLKLSLIMTRRDGTMIVFLPQRSSQFRLMMKVDYVYKHDLLSCNIKQSL